MAEFDEGTAVDVVEPDVWGGADGDEAYEPGVIDFDEQEPEAEEPAEAVAEEEDDPWAWAKGEDPEKVRKTWSRFTQELETVKERERRLEQEDRALDRYRAIAKEIESDPGLVEVIQGYMEKGATPEAQLQNMRQELLQLQTQVQVQREITDLHKTVAAKGLPDFDDEDLVRHAIDIGAPSMEVAYKDLMFDVAQEKRVNGVVKDIKKSRGAQAPKSSKEGGEVKKGFSTVEIANMSEEEFLKNYDAIMKQAAARGGRSI